MTAAALLLALAPAASADDYPNRPVRLIIPFPPGGSNDVVGRLVAQQLSVKLGQQVYVDNRGGAGGTIGTEACATAAPDGYTICVISIAHAVNPALYTLKYDPIKSFTPISIFATGPNVLVVNPTSPIKSVKELLALAKEKPGELNYASAGVGSFQHLGAELFKLQAGVDIVHVPYKGGGPAMQDVIAGHVKIMFSSLVQTTPFIKSGQLIALGTGGAKRNPVLPGRADDRGSRRARLCRGQLVGPGRAGRAAPADRRQALRGVAGGVEIARTAGRLRPRGRGNRRDDPGPVRRLHQDRNRQMGPRGQGREHPRAVKMPPPLLKPF